MPITPLASGAAKLRAYRSAPSRSRATVGITVVTAIASNATKPISAHMPIVMAAYVGLSRRGPGAVSDIRVTIADART